MALRAIQVPTITIMPYTLLTGATGLLGGYLLRDLLRRGEQVVVLARSTAVLAASRRIDTVLAPWEGERFLARPVILEGDLNRPGLGLCEADRAWLGANCDRVLHSAASISFYREEKSGEPYRTNVDGTQNLIELCLDLGLHNFHHISTAYVCGRRSGTVLESELDVGQESGNDYERSKVSSEKLIRAAQFGTPATIYRPSIIIGDSKSGYTTTFHGYYTPLQVALWLARAGVIKTSDESWFLRELNLSGDERKNIVPVDWVSAAIVKIAAQDRCRGRTYHITNPNPPTSDELATAISNVVSRRMASEHGSHATVASVDGVAQDFRKHMDVYRAYFRDHPEFDTHNLNEAIGDLPCPQIDRATLERTAQFAMDCNFGWPRPMPPIPPVDVESFLRNAVRYDLSRSRESWVLEASGPGGGAWTIRSEAGRDTVIERVRIGRTQTTIRLSTETFKAITERWLSLPQAIYSGRLLVSGNTPGCEAALEWLESAITSSVRSVAADRGGIQATTRVRLKEVTA